MDNYSQARRLMTKHYPHERLVRQQRVEWKGEFDLPNSVVDYYQKFGPVNVRLQGLGNDYFLPSLRGLWKFQNGYRFNGSTGERIPEWKNDWLVVADEGGDPFVLSRKQDVVLFGFHGEGHWKFTKVFPTIAAMVTGLVILGSLVKLAKAAGANLFDSNSPVTRRMFEKAKFEFIGLLGSAYDAKRTLITLGWQWPQ